MCRELGAQVGNWVIDLVIAHGKETVVLQEGIYGPVRYDGALLSASL